MSRKVSALPVLHVAEPPAALLGRPPIVVCCSVLSAVLFGEDTHDEALRILTGKTLHAPLLLDSEMASVALKKGWAGLPAPAIRDALSDYARQAIEHHRPDVEVQYTLAQRVGVSACRRVGVSACRRVGVSAYDAAYLWVAGFLKAPLATYDAKLAKAARAYLAEAG